MAVTITAISPNNENNAGLVEVIITGTNFQTDPATNVYLINGAIQIFCTNFVIQSDTQITCDFDINGQTAQIYNVVVESGLGDGTLVNGFTIASNNNYCTYADVKRFCQIDRLNQNNNQKIQQLIPRASEMIDINTKRVWNQRAFLETHDDSTQTIEENILFPEYYPIDSVVSLLIDGNAQTEGTNFWVYPTFIRALLIFASEPRGIVLSYIGGPTTIPDFIRQMAVEITSILANLKTVTYTTEDGIDKAVILTTFPDYINETYKKFKKVELW